MPGYLRALCLAAVLGSVSAGSAFGSNILVGGENWRFKTDLDAVGGGSDFVAHHSLSAVTSEWRLNKNVRLNLNFGQITSTLDGGTPSGPGNGLYLLAGFSLEQELDTGGGLLIDGSYSFGWTDFDSATEYDHTRAHLMLGYLFGQGERSRVFAGIAYNVYESDLIVNSVTTSSYQSDGRVSIVVGIRARTDSFVGTVELSAIGEYGFRLGMSFGF